jgi:serine/threonine-protein kinase
VLGEVVGNYRITGKLAVGGMGAVYRAEHAMLGRPAAVKVLLPELSQDRDTVARFFTEARAASAVRHPGIVEIYDFGHMANGAAFIVMELLEGQTLARLLATRRPLPEEEALLYARGIASALAAAHAQGIVHRDLKPDNVFLVPDLDIVGGVRPKILDFGIAKVSEAQRGGTASAKTRTGSVIGTPTYMSPEQCRGNGEIDHRSDLYSLGCIVYEMLVGKPPFASDGIGEVLGMHLYVAPTAPTAAGAAVSVEADALVMQLLAKNPAERIQSAADLARLLGQGSLPMAVSAPRLSSAIGAATPVPGAYATPAGYLTPAPPAMPTPGPTQLVSAEMPTVMAPTTLSGASGSTAVMPGDPPRRRRGLAIALVGAGVAAAGIAAILVVGRDGAGATTTTPATPPVAATGVDAGAPAVVTPVDAAPADAPTPIVDAAPAIDATPDAPPKRRPNRGGRHGEGTRGGFDRGD